MTKKKKIKSTLCLSLPELIELHDLQLSIPRSQKEIELFESLPVESAPLLKTMRAAGAALSLFESEDDSFYFIFSQLTYIFSRFKYSLSIGVQSNDAFIMECLQHHPVLVDEYIKALVQSGEVKPELFKTKNNDSNEDRLQDRVSLSDCATQTDQSTEEVGVQTEFVGVECSSQTELPPVPAPRDVQHVSIQTDLPLDFACQVEMVSRPIRRVAVKKPVVRVRAPRKGPKEPNKQDQIDACCPPTKMSYSAVLRQSAAITSKIASPSAPLTADPGVPVLDVGNQAWKRRFKTVVKRVVTKVIDDEGFVSFVKKRIKIDKPYPYMKRPQ